MKQTEKADVPIAAKGKEDNGTLSWKFQEERLLPECVAGISRPVATTLDQRTLECLNRGWQTYHPN